MNVVRRTTSLCSTCYKEVPAYVSVEPAGVFMYKKCREHGETSGLLERDPIFYQYITGMRYPSIYNGYFVDVTRRCNLRCKYCYYALQKEDPAGEYSINRILDECEANAHLAPFIITGGEPTIREDICDLVAQASGIGPVELLTNGVRLADEKLFSELMPLITSNGVANLNLSIHGSESDAWREVTRRCMTHDIKIESALIVVDSKESFMEAVQMAKDLSHTVMAVRIKAASRIWNEQKPTGKIYVSDMLGWLNEMGGYELITTRQNKSVFVNVIWNNTVLMLVSWHDITNIDLQDINCPPYYRARNGEVLNFVTAGMVNQGLQAGWLKGRKVTPQ